MLDINQDKTHSIDVYDGYKDIIDCAHEFVAL